jgi:hypothetical protein
MSTATLNGMSVNGPPMPRLRITQRGRRVLTVIVALPLVVAAFAFALNGGMAVATNVASSASLSYVTVGAGQSLWQLAVRIAPSADPREVISDIVRVNQLGGSDVQAGQRLAVPAQYSK